MHEGFRIRGLTAAAATSAFRKRFGGGVVASSRSSSTLCSSQQRQRGVANTKTTAAQAPSSLLSVGQQSHHPPLSLSVPPANCSYFSSTSSSSSSDERLELYSILTREHAEEVESDSTLIPTELDELKNSLQSDHNWKIVDDGAVTKMYRTADDDNKNKVMLSFHCQDTVEISDGDYVDDEDHELIGETDEEAAGPVRFTVTVTKAGGKTLAFTCLSEDATVRIQSVSILADVSPDAFHTKSGGVLDSYQYQGPEFNELAEDLQEAFHTYLMSEYDIGITEDVASFVSMYTDYREQMEYVKFLDDAKSIL